MFETILEAIRLHDRIVLHRHVNPDGDALGSQIGLKHILRENFPDKQVRAVGDGAGRYAFMDDSIMDDVPDAFYEGALAIILDTSAAHLISDGRYVLAASTARLDHHIFCGQIAQARSRIPATRAAAAWWQTLRVRAACACRLSRPSRSLPAW